MDKYIQKVEYKHVNSRKIRSEGWNDNKTIKPLTSKFAGHNWSLSLGQVLRCWDVAAGDLRLLRRGWGQLFVLHFCFGHVVVPRVKVFWLEKVKRYKVRIVQVRYGQQGPFQLNYTPFWSLFLRRSEPPGFVPRLGYLAFNLASSAFSGLMTLSSSSFKTTIYRVKKRRLAAAFQASSRQNKRQLKFYSYSSNI